MKKLTTLACYKDLNMPPTIAAPESTNHCSGELGVSCDRILGLIDHALTSRHMYDVDRCDDVDKKPH